MARTRNASTNSPTGVAEQDQQIKKHVGAIHTSGSLTLLQRKLTNVLLFNAYEELISKRTHKLPVNILCAMLGWNESKDIQSLRDALRALVSTTVEFNLTEEGKERWQVMSMLSYGEISGGYCTYRYDEELAKRLFDPQIYAMINLRVQRQFSAGHALNLYENCMRYRNVGSTGWWTIDFFREVVGAVDGYYDDFRRLSSRVIKPCIEQINKVSDIHIEPEYRREMRRVTAIRFAVAEVEKQQQAIPGTSIKENLDSYQDIRETEVYKSLRTHGISDRLAIVWIRDEGAERVDAIIQMVEDRDQKKQIKGSTAGYIRTLIEEKAEVGQTAYETQREEARKHVEAVAHAAEDAAKLDSLKEDFQRQQMTEAMKALSPEERTQYAQRFEREEGHGREMSWNAEKLDFNESWARVAFMTWLRKTVAPEFDEAAFEAWRKSKRQARTGQGM